DKTASSSATPSFLLYGDGSGARYSIFIDGTSIGTYTTDPFGNTCILTPTPPAPLSQGPHVLTANELSPLPSNIVAPFNFSVDSLPPNPPSTPAMTTFADTGAPGD